MWYVALVLPSLLTYFDPQPSAAELPERMPSPFAMEPHALARRAAQLVASEIQAAAPGFAHDFDKTGDGKMFGVLVVVDQEGRVGFLRAVSGMLGGQWRVQGFAPPLFDLEDRERFWPAGQVRLAEIEQELQQLLEGPDAQRLADEASAMKSQHAGSLEELRARQGEERSQRARRREEIELLTDEEQKAKKLEALAEESRASRREGKLLRKEQELSWQEIADRQAAMEAARLQIKRKRRDVSNGLLVKIQDGYRLINARGESASLASLYAPQEPPGGSGDCAAPKLLGYANRHGLRPIALAEFWWGAEPSGGGRHSEHFYPPCKSKCGPLLPFLLEGTPHEEAPIYATETLAEEEPQSVYEDEWIVVVDKPCGMLSVPGAHARLKDSAQTRLRARYPQAEGPLLAHRLDLDTSGLLIMAKSLDVYREVQALFAARKVEKRYVAWLDGEVLAESGEIRLALRVDLEDRPRQIHDPEHGKDAITSFEVLERHGGFTKVAFLPRTGRTHQLRVHAAHQEGLGAPIVGDRLYGKGQGRLLLHAESLRFQHPKTGEALRVCSPLPEALAEPPRTPIRLKS
jgi:tRNA pseudouridine32 synthase/23S rRNA pseudouridine746 synthase